MIWFGTDRIKFKHRFLREVRNFLSKKIKLMDLMMMRSDDDNVDDACHKQIR